MKRYVQSKWSKDAPVYEVAIEADEFPHLWACRHDKETYHNDYCYLPKSEYHEVPAPERWERVGDDRITVRTDKLSLVVDGKQVGYLAFGYRWAWDKRGDGTLVIERKVTE